MLWLIGRTVRAAPVRVLLGALGAALPVATLAATLLFVDDSLQAMTRVALTPVQVELRAEAASLDVDMRSVEARLSAVPGVARADLFGSADVVLSAPGVQHRVTARLFAVDPSYLEHHRWVRTSGGVGTGLLLNTAAALALPDVSSVTITLPNTSSAWHLTMPVTGQVDLRSATTWFAIPTGDVQGDLAVVPRAVLVDYATFARTVLPALRATLGAATAVANPGLTDLPPASNEAHLTVRHASYPTDPRAAAAWSSRLRRTLDAAAPGQVVIADNAAEPLTEAAADATDAKILFLLLGLPGALVAAALGLTAAAALTETQRREDALLRLRGSTESQLARLAVGQGLLSATVGTALGLVVAVAGVTAVVGHQSWREIPAGRLAQSLVLAVLFGAITTAARLVPLARAGHRVSISTDRRRLDMHRPAWLRRRLDVVAVAVGTVLLIVNSVFGGLRPTPVEGQAVALSFYVLLAPIALWAGGTLLAVRGLRAVLVRSSRPDRPTPLRSWSRTGLRWLARRPSRLAATVALGALAVGFGTEVAVFTATYHAAQRNDAAAAFGADLRLTPLSEDNAPLPHLGAEVAGATPIRTVPARVGSDRKTILAIDLASYPSATTTAPQITRGRGVAGLVNGVLVANELATGLQTGPGDQLPVTVYPDAPDRSRQLSVHVVGVYRAFAPTDPGAELVMATTAIPGPLPPPDFYLVRVAPGRDPADVAARLRRETTFAVTEIGGRLRDQQRSLTAIALSGLSRIEITAAGLLAAVGIGALGAFLILERRREFAVLVTMGTDTRQLLTGPLLEGALAAVASLLIGIPVGLGAGILTAQVLGLFFALPPPLAVVPLGQLAALAGLVTVSSAVALGLALLTVQRNINDALRAA